MNTEQQIEIVKANGAGKLIEGRHLHISDSWHLTSPFEPLNFAEYEYRIKEQPESIKVDVWRTKGGVLGIKCESSPERKMELFSSGGVLVKTVTIEV